MWALKLLPLWKKKIGNVARGGCRMLSMQGLGKRGGWLVLDSDRSWVAQIVIWMIPIPCFCSELGWLRVEVKELRPHQKAWSWEKHHQIILGWYVTTWCGKISLRISKVQTFHFPLLNKWKYKPTIHPATPHAPGNGYVPWNTVLSLASSRVTVVVMLPSTLVAIAMGSAAIRCLGRFGIFGCGCCQNNSRSNELF